MDTPICYDYLWTTLLRMYVWIATVAGIDDFTTHLCTQGELGVTRVCGIYLFSVCGYLFSKHNLFEWENA